MPDTAVADKVFDPKAFFAERNAADAASKNPKQVADAPKTPEVQKKVEVTTPDRPEEAAKPGQPEAEEGHPARLPRSIRRELNRLREQLGAERAKREMLEAQHGAKPKAEAPKEPQRADYKTDAEFVAATAKHAVQEGLASQNAESEAVKELRERIQTAQAKQPEYIKDIPEWEKIAEDAKELEFGDNGVQLSLMMAESDVSSLMIEHFVSNPDEWDALVELNGKDVQQRRIFHRLEGVMEAAHKQRVQAAQATKKVEKPSEEDRKDPAEATAGRNANGSDKKPLPKPSSEVSATGGSAPPDEPPIGSKAWMAKRNAEHQSSRF